jgi:hypothetical protein
MARIKRTYVRCTKCETDFLSPKQFATLAELERAARTGLIGQCSQCYSIVECGAANMYCEWAPRDRRSQQRRPEPGLEASEPRPLGVRRREDCYS